MATLTLGKSVTVGAVQSKKGDSVFVERRRKIVIPGTKELREEPTKVEPTHNAADEKLRAVLAQAKAREEERKKREAEEEAARKALEAEKERENREYEQVKEQLAQREKEKAQVEEEIVDVHTKIKNPMLPNTTKIVVIITKMIHVRVVKTVSRKISRNLEKYLSMILLSVVAKMMMMTKLEFVVPTVVAVKRH